jgi:drug/metabolite transporter (DMT)-like permease
MNPPSPPTSRDAALPSGPPLLAVGALMINALVWGLSWWPFRQLQDLGLHPLWSTALIYVAAAAFVLAWRPLAWRQWSAHPGLWLLMVAAGMTNVGFNWAVSIGDVVRVVLLFYLMPAWSIVLAWPMLGERPTRAALLRLLLALAGVVIVLKSPDSPWPLPHSAADWLAVGGGLSFALTNILLRRYGHTPSEGRMLAMFGGGAIMASAAALLGMGLGTIAAPALQAPGWPVALGLCLAFLISNLALQYGAARLAASTTALAMLTEILFASVSSAWLGAAELQARTLIGGGLIILASLLAALQPGSRSG